MRFQCVRTRGLDPAERLLDDVAAGDKDDGEREREVEHERDVDDLVQVAPARR
jgi:hypothetical protein